MLKSLSNALLSIIGEKGYNPYEILLLIATIIIILLVGGLITVAIMSNIRNSIENER